MKRIRTRAALLLTLCLVLSAVWFMGVLRAYGDWCGVLTPAPAEIWADAGETVTVSFVGSLVGEEAPATMMGRDDQGRERVFTRVGPEWVPVNDSNGSTTSAGNALSKRVTVPSYYAGGTLSVTMQVRVAYWWELAGLDPRLYSRPYDYQYVEATCLIHVRSAPAPQSTPTLPYPPYPTPAPRRRIRVPLRRIRLRHRVAQRLRPRRRIASTTRAKMMARARPVRSSGRAARCWTRSPTTEHRIRLCPRRIRHHRHRRPLRRRPHQHSRANPPTKRWRQARACRAKWKRRTTGICTPPATTASNGKT